MTALASCVEHLGKMRDEIIALGIIPAVEEWTKENPNL
jgi:malate dehydrogenase